MDSLPSTLVLIAWSVFGYMTAWFLLALLLKRRDVVDSAWGLGFVVVTAIAYGQRNNESSFTHIALVLVALWGVRLSLHITARNFKKKEDYRYAQLGELNTAKHWAKTYLSVFLLQGILMIVISFPVIAIMHADTSPLAAVAVFGSAVWLFGIIFEAVGDYQLRAFLKVKNKGEVMQSGLWRYTRHPNYFGEVTAWWGVTIVALSFGQWWGIAGALVITILITKLSGIPLLERRYADNPAFQKYAKQTSLFFPLPRRTIK